VPTRERWQAAIDYIAATPAVRDVLISGGDPLTLPDDKLEWILSKLREIPHVEVLRIGTKAPVVLPQRITPALVRMLKRYHPLWISIHFTHPDELTPETAEACRRLADGGIPLQSQTVLLAGINDDPDTMRRLVQGLVRIRVRPYYLYQCDPIVGSSHFRTPRGKGRRDSPGAPGIHERLRRSDLRHRRPRRRREDPASCRVCGRQGRERSRPQELRGGISATTTGTTSASPSGTEITP
jgi:lysine 2,3-aminomutase